MDYNNMQEIQKYMEKKKPIELNRTKSMFEHNVAIHVNDTMTRSNTVNSIPTIENENLSLQKQAEEKNMTNEFDLPQMTEQIENVEMRKQQDVQNIAQIQEQKELVSDGIHIQIQEKEEKKKVVYQQLQPGEALEKYIQEVKQHPSTRNGKEELENAIKAAEKCRLQMNVTKEGQRVPLAQLQGQISDINAAILQIDRYIKRTKGFGKTIQKGEAQEEKRNLRESAKMLRIQLFLEKMDLYEKIELENQKEEEKKVEKVDEYKLYLQQLDADARTQIYNEYKENNINEVEETAKTYIGKTKMEQKKSEQLILEDNRQIAKYSKKITESESRAKELQEKISNNGFDLRHKQFLKSESYQQRIAQKVMQIRPRVVKEWMSDNFERIQENAGKLREIFGQKGLETKKVNGLSMKEVASLLQTELKDDESLDYIAVKYDTFYKKLSNLSPSTWPMFPREIKDLVAAQIVLFEKRELLKKEYNKATQSQETQNTKADSNTNTIPVPPPIKYNIPKAPAIKYNIPKAPAIKYNIPKAPILRNQAETQVVSVHAAEAQKNRQLDPDWMAELLQVYLAQMKQEKENETLRKLLNNKKNRNQAPNMADLSQAVALKEMNMVAGMGDEIRTNLLDYGTEEDYVAQFLEKRGLEHKELELEEISEESWLTEQEKENTATQALESVHKYKQLYTQMLDTQGVMGQQAKEEYGVMMQLLGLYANTAGFFQENNHTEATALVSRQTLINSVKAYILAVMGRTPDLAEDKPVVIKVQNNAKYNLNKIWKVIEIKRETLRPARAMYQLLSDGNNNRIPIPKETYVAPLTDEKEKELMLYSVEELVKEAQLSNERQSQMEQTEKEKETLAHKKKVEDLENQKNNNEYALQGMASEEKEKELERAEEKKKEEERRNQQEIEHKQEDETILPQLNQKQQMIVRNAIKDLATESGDAGINIKKENNKLVLGFMARYKEMRDLIDQYAEEKDKIAYHAYIDNIRETFFKKYHENEKEYVAEQEYFDADKIGDIVREMTEFYGERMMEMQALYEPLLKMQETIEINS